jgi:hypothetical protein
MLTFKSFLSEAMEQSDLPGVPKVLHDFLFHVSGPSDNTPTKRGMKESADLDEAVLFDINRDRNPSTGATHILSAHKSMNLPKSSGMIQQAEDEGLGKGVKLHKTMGEGFRKSFSAMESEKPEESKAKLKESKKVFDEFSKSRGYKKAPPLLGENGKTKKSTGEGVHTLGLALAPHATNGIHGFDVCPNASKECRKNCLGTEAGGNRQYPDFALASKILRTHFIAKHPEHAARILDHEVGKHVKAATKAGYKPGVRLNVTSDISWEKHAPQLFTRHPEAQFYDYTKLHNRVGHPDLPKNYHLSLSHTGANHEESNDKHAVDKLEKGHVVAMVYHRGKNVPKPTHVEDVKSGKRYPLVGGDEDDNTFDRHAQAGLTEGKKGEGVVSGLKLKGVKNEDAGKFANKVDKDGVIRINK